MPGVGAVHSIDSGHSSVSFECLAGQLLRTGARHTLHAGKIFKNVPGES